MTPGGDLVLLRHGIALDRSVAARRNLRDDERPLTREGIEKTVAAAAGLAAFVRARPATVWTSPLLRARQTADIAAEAFGAPPPRVHTALAPGEDPACALEEAVKTGANAILLVGHAPDLGDFAAELLGARPGTCPLKKAGAAVLRARDGRMRLVAHLPPRVLRGLSPGA
ncbi:MAG: hypothetical protein D6705_00015 [Deltaproteobacteria bacterium]|nr:MAG: hypothetical protein D6705_00015 [Deltaproteobacteria bacterium]